MPFQATVGGKHGGCIGTRGRVHETTTDSGTRWAKPGDGIHIPGLFHRHRLDARGIPAYAQGRGGGRGRTERRGLCSGPGGQPPVPAGPSQVRSVPGASGASGPHPQGRIGDRDSAAGYTDLRGQGAPACGRHGLGSGLRAGLQGLFVRLPSGTVGASSAGEPLAADDGDGRRLDRGGRYPKILRYDRPRTSAGVAQATGARRGAASTDRQMAQRGRAGRRMRHASRSRLAAGRGR
jgi:hypothetical protein